MRRRLCNDISPSKHNFRHCGECRARACEPTLIRAVGSFTVLPPSPLLPKDDYGWNNIGIHARSQANAYEIQTPNMDDLAATGITLERHYTFHFCSPSRSAFHTGRNPIHVNVLNSDLAAANVTDPVSGFAGIPRNMTTIAAKLKEAGYATAAAGKWHLGLATPDHTPLARGYDDSLIYWSGSNGYWTDECTGWCGGSVGTVDLWLGNSSSGYNGPAFGMNNSVACSQANQSAGCVYEDELLTRFSLDVLAKAARANKPQFLYFAPHSVHVSAMGLQLEVPAAQEAKFANITDSAFRRKYAAMTNLVDSQIGRLVDALKSTNMWDNTLLVLSADNGGLVIADGFGGANNYPLRGGKQTNFEGGVRVNALVSGGFVPLARRGSSEEGLIEIADWFKTFCGLAGVDSDDERAAAANLPPVEGFDQWPLLSGANSTPPRTEVWLGDHIPEGDGSSGPTIVDGIIRADGFKLLTGVWGGGFWQGPFFPNASTNEGHDDLDCGTTAAPKCLWNVFDDPTEHVNLIDQFPDIATALAKRLDELQAGVFSPNRGPSLAKLACNTSNQKWGGFVGPFLP